MVCCTERQFRVDFSKESTLNCLSVPQTNQGNVWSSIHSDNVNNLMMHSSPVVSVRKDLSKQTIHSTSCAGEQHLHIKFDNSAEPGSLLQSKNTVHTTQKRLENCSNTSNICERILFIDCHQTLRSRQRLNEQMFWLKKQDYNDRIQSLHKEESPKHADTGVEPNTSCSNRFEMTSKGGRVKIAMLECAIRESRCDVYLLSLLSAV
jgi:hypothetical protein